MITRIIILLLMIGWDLSLHIVELFGKVASHPLYPSFPLFGFLSYDLFWTLFLGIAFIIMFTLLFRSEEKK